MSEVCTARATTEQIHKSFSAKESGSEGILKGENGKEYGVFVYKDTGSTSKGVSEFLSEMSHFETLPESFEFTAVWIPLSEAEVYVEIQQLLQDLGEEAFAFLKEANSETLEKQFSEASARSSFSQGKTLEKKENSEALKQPLSTATRQEFSPREPKVQPPTYSSIFALAKALSPVKPSQSESKKEEKNEQPPRNESKPSHFSGFSSSLKESNIQQQQHSYHEEKQEKQGKQDQQGKEGKEQEKEKKENRHDHPHAFERKNPSKKKKLGFSIEGIHAAKASSEIEHRNASKNQLGSVRGSTQDKTPKHKSTDNLGGVENIYIRFMALMARILGQAEAEAHELYQRIKSRTDDVDTLTHFISKINSSKGKIDWTKDEEMKQLVEKVRALGVDIPAGKLTWTEEEKKMLKENVQMKKDSMEKITQLERTDMQRYLQEASQCHQARSNVLKLLKEVMDTIIANMRP